MAPGRGELRGSPEAGLELTGMSPAANHMASAAAAKTAFTTGC